MTSFEYILFDWDGTLANTLPVWMESFKVALKHHKIEVEDSHIARHLFPNMNLATEYGVKDFNSFSTQVIEAAYANAPFAKLHIEVEATIKQLRAKGKKTAIVTSAQRKLIDKALKQHNLTDSFDIVLAREDTVKKKPDPEVLFKAMKFIKADPSTTIMVGDSEADIHAGKNAGIKTVLHYPKENEIFYSEELIAEIGPDFTIRSFQKLLDIVG